MEAELNDPCYGNRRHDVFAVIIVSFASVLAYHHIFFNEFSWDDGYLVLDNEAIRDISNVPSLFTEPWASRVGYTQGRLQNQPYFRPLALTSMAIDYAIAGPDPLVFHTTNLLLHILAAILLYLWLSRVVVRIPIKTPSEPSYSIWPFIFATLYALHPVHTEAVNVVSYRTTLLQGVFVFATLLALAPEQPTFRRLLAGTLSFASGLLSKETALVTPALLLLQDFFLVRFTRRRIATVYFPLAIVATAWLLYRSTLIGSGTYDFFEGLDAYQKVLLVPRILFLYIKLAIIPYPLCPFYDWWVIGVPRSPLEPDILAGTLFLIGLPVFIWIFSATVPRVSFGIAFFLIALLPVSHIVPFFDAAGERFMYVPLAGVLVALWGLCEHLSALRRAAYVVFVVLVVVLGSLTALRTAQWQNSETILKATTRYFPSSVSAHLGLAQIMLHDNRPAEAVEHLRTVTKLAPSLSIGYGLLAVALARSGHLDEARITLLKAPLPERNMPSAAQIARNEFLVRGELWLIQQLGM